MKNNGLLLSILLLLFTSNIFAQNFIVPTDFKLSTTMVNTNSFFAGESEIYFYSINDLSMNKLNLRSLTSEIAGAEEMRNIGIGITVAGGLTAISGLAVAMATGYDGDTQRLITGLLMFPVGGLIVATGLIIWRVGVKKVRKAKANISIETSGSNLGLRYTF